MLKAVAVWGSLGIGAILLAACGAHPDHAGTNASMSPVPAEAGGVSASTDAARIRWKTPDGAVLLELKPKDGDYRLYDADDRPLGKVRVQDDRVKLRDAEGNELRKIKLKDNGAEIEDANGSRLFRIKRDDDGSYKLSDAGGETVAKLKKKDDGYEVRDAAGATLAKVKPREGKLVLKSEGGEALGEVKGLEDARAGMWLALPDLSLGERGALVVYYLAVDRRGF